MDPKRRRLNLSTVSELVSYVGALARGMTLPERLAPAPVPAYRRIASVMIRRRIPSDSVWTTRIVALLLPLLIVGAVPAWADRASLPPGVPNIFDPQVRAHFQPVGVANLRGNPDFPVLILKNTTGNRPQTMMVGMDARNAKATWSLASDPIILIVLFAEPAKIEGLYVDAGFADQGKPSGHLEMLEDPNSTSLTNLLRSVSDVTTWTFM